MIASAAVKPRMRAMFVDARTRPRPSIIDGLVHLRHAKRVIGTGHIKVETAKYDVLLEIVDDAVPLPERVERCRGIDFAVVVAGRATGTAARDLQVLHACGVRRAITLVPGGGPADLRENLGRHLLLGALLDADGLPVVPLHAEPEDLSDDEAIAFKDAVDAVALPREPGRFLVGGVFSRENYVVTSRVLRGTVEGPSARGFLWNLNGFREVEFETPRRAAGDAIVLDIGIGVSELGRSPADITVVDRELSMVRRVVVEDLERPLRDGEHLTAFGGDLGFTDASVHRGVIELAAPVALVDGRLGLVRTLGYAKVSSVAARPAPSRRG